ncbi:MAG: hypothetical protein WBG90_10650 [Saonia sp.]
MKKFAKNGWLLVFLIMSLYTVKAQRVFEFVPKDPLQRSEKVTRWMSEKWGLDSLQESKLRGINEKYAKLMQPILESKGQPMDKFNDAETLIGDRIIETKALLAEKQWVAIVERCRIWKPKIEIIFEKFLGK